MATSRWSILDENQSMSLERVFRLRKMIQNDNCSRFECEGLTDRLRVCHNNAEPSSVESVTLYTIAYKYWDACAADC